METKNIHQRILSVMRKVKAVTMEEKKSGMQYRFVSHSALTRAIQNELVEHGITILPSVVEHHMDGNLIEMLVELRLTNADKPEDFVCVRSIGHGVGKDDKIAGKAFTYAWKTALLKVFVLENSEEDTDEVQNSFEEYKPKKKEISQEAATEAGNDFKKKPKASL